MLHPADERAQSQDHLPPLLRGRGAQPFDNPLSSRFDENDSVLIFDGVFVPWENVLIYRDIERARSFYSASGFLNRYPLQSGTRLAVKMDFICGLLAKVLESNGSDGFRGVRTRLADIVALRNLMWSLTESLCHNPEPRQDGSVVPRLEAAATVRYFGTQMMSQLKPVFNTILGGSPIMQVSSWLDLRNPDINELIGCYFQGTDQEAVDRLADQAAVGRAGQRIRRPPRAVRAQLRRQQRASAAGHAAPLREQRRAGTVPLAGGRVHVRLHPGRLGASGLAVRRRLPRPRLNRTGKEASMLYAGKWDRAGLDYQALKSNGTWWRAARKSARNNPGGAAAGRGTGAVARRQRPDPRMEGLLRPSRRQAVAGLRQKGEIECPYHGWRFDAGGQCTRVPAHRTRPRRRRRG